MEGLIIEMLVWTQAPRKLKKEGPWEEDLYRQFQGCFTKGGGPKGQGLLQPTQEALVKAEDKNGVNQL